MTPNPAADLWGILIRPGPSDVPAGVRMKQWLKIGKRRFGLVCEDLTAGVPVRVVYVERPKRKAKA